MDNKNRNLFFLHELFSRLGLTLELYVKLTSNSVNIYRMLRMCFEQDDMKVSKATDIISSLGYELIISFSEKNNTQALDTIENEIVPNRGIPDSKFENQGAHRYENLYFLWKFMQQRNISKRQLSRDIGLTAGAVFTWFNSDDIAISHLYTIKDKYGVELHFSVKTK